MWIDRQPALIDGYIDLERNIIIVSDEEVISEDSVRNSMFNFNLILKFHSATMHITKWKI